MYVLTKKDIYIYIHIDLLKLNEFVFIFIKKQTNNTFLH